MGDSDGALMIDVGSRTGTAVEVTVRGEVDVDTCGQLEMLLLGLADDGVATVTLDISGVGFIDSSGLRALVVGHKALEERGGSLVVANPSSMAARLLEVTGLDTVFGAGQS